MPEERPADPVSDPRRQAAAVVRRVRLALEAEGRAGLTAVPRARKRAAAGESPAAPASGSEKNAHAAAGSDAEAEAAEVEAAIEAANIPASAPPEEQAATALREDLMKQVRAASVETDLFGFVSPDLAEGISRTEALARIAAEVAQCDRCPELCKGRTKTVPGQGDPNAKLVFVGEGPGQEEDRQGLAFVGRAGELLTKMIEAIGLTRDQVFICNIVKCRPPSNRTPMPDEMANCMPYLARQLEILKPKVLCALGGTAAKALLQTDDGITRLRGRFHPYRGVPLMPTFHPAYVLRSYTPDTRKKVYDDLLQVRATLNA